MKMNGVYVLGLESHRYYVGWSKDINHRIQQHLSGTGAQWTKTYPPREIIEIRIGKHLDEEARLTRFYMGKYGIDNVRGGPWCSINLPDNPLMICEEYYDACINGTVYSGIENMGSISEHNFHQLRPVSHPVLTNNPSLPTIDHHVILEYQQTLRCPVNRKRLFRIFYACDGETCESDHDGQLPCEWRHVTHIESLM